MINKGIHMYMEDKKKYLPIKSFFEPVIAGLGLVILSPLLLLICMIIKLSDKNAPIFFKQVRVGKNGQEFTMYKFRSMRVDAEEMLEELLHQNEIEGAMFKMKEDPRITTIGKLLRKTSIDELPQLWNVIKKEMALVGPRPPLPREVAEYSVYHKSRLLVKPGCTGLWQVSGRNELNFHEMVELDLSYIKGLSWYLDVKIILKTIGVMLLPKNAY